MGLFNIVCGVMLLLSPAVPVTDGLVGGNSTIAAYPPGETTAIADLIFTSGETTIGYSATNFAVPGSTINEQRVTFAALPNKERYQWIIIEPGLNDLNPAESAATAIGRYQTFVNEIRVAMPTAKIIVGAMIECKQRMIDVYGSTNGLIAFQKLRDMNTSIMGGGSFPITGVDGRYNEHVSQISDASGNLKPQYESSLNDHIHYNNAGRAFTAAAVKNKLIALHLVRPAA
jgi:hypothetical protein